MIMLLLQSFHLLRPNMCMCNYPDYFQMCDKHWIFAAFPYLHLWLVYSCWIRNWKSGLCCHSICLHNFLPASGDLNKLWTQVNNKHKLQLSSFITTNVQFIYSRSPQLFSGTSRPCGQHLNGPLSSGSENRQKKVCESRYTLHWSE